LKNFEKLPSECCSLPFSVLLRFLAWANGEVCRSLSLPVDPINTASTSVSPLPLSNDDLDVDASAVDTLEVDASAVAEVDTEVLFFALVELDPDKKLEILSLSLWFFLYKNQRKFFETFWKFLKNGYLFANIFYDKDRRISILYIHFFLSHFLKI